VTPGAKRDAAMHAQTAFGLSERRACDLVGVSRRVARYRSTRPDGTPLRVRLRELAAERRRFGYRRLEYRLACEGMTPNYKKLLRIYREEGLRVRRRSGRKRALGTRAPMTTRRVRTSAGRWTSSLTASSVAGASASCVWSTTSAENAWHWLPIHRSRVPEWRAS
jgi:hypothetical protein